MQQQLKQSKPLIINDISNTATGFFQIPAGTTAQRPATPLDGMRRYNTTTLRDEFYANGAWQNHARTGGDTFTGTVTAPSIVSDSTNTKQLKTTFINIIPTGTAGTIDLNTGSAFFIDFSNAGATGTGNYNLTITNALAGSSCVIFVKQASTPRNIVFPTGTVQNRTGGVTYTGVSLSLDQLGLYFTGNNLPTGANTFLSVNTNFQ